MTEDGRDGHLRSCGHSNGDGDMLTELNELSHADLISRVMALESQLNTTTGELKKLAARAISSQQSAQSENQVVPTVVATRHNDTDGNHVAGQQRQQNQDQKSQSSKVQKKLAKPFDPSSYASRHIALKFSYIGTEYNGFEHTNNSTSAPPKPTIEEALWKALRKSRLISPIVPPGADQSYEVVWDEKERATRYGAGMEGLGKGRKGRERLELVWDGLEYSKCGRTDRGVSAFGQVVGVRVRSNRPVAKRRKNNDEDQITNARGHAEPQDADRSDMEQLRGLNIGLPTAKAGTEKETGIETSIEKSSPMSTAQHEGQEGLDADNATSGWHPVRDELSYISMLNRVLPPSIRVLAWCPHPPSLFDARFSCRERRYKYFFTNPAMFPTPGTPGLRRPGEPGATVVRDGWLDIHAMRTAAKKLEGLHDYRNFCKIDASKQMSSCERRVTFADIEEFSPGLDGVLKGARWNQTGSGTEGVLQDLMSRTVGDVSSPKVYAFAVHGTAFLWHQVRCMVAVLFLVGQGLEPPEIVDKLLDIKETPGRPHYEMADDAPLVLWDCVFPSQSPGDETGLEWVYPGDTTDATTAVEKGATKFGSGSLVDQLWSQWREAKMQETLAAGLLGLALRLERGMPAEDKSHSSVSNDVSRSQRVFDGSAAPRSVGSYIPIMKRPKMETLEVQNAKYAAGKQSRRDLKKAQSSNVESN